jgi:(p)ppGpp synthase/HD superfamily hydrolase
MISPPRLSMRFEQACLWAMSIHRNDFRKGTTIPYVSHLFGTCALVLADGGSEDEAIAALFHDAVEDHPGAISAGEIAATYGMTVAEIVSACTGPSNAARMMTWRERKIETLERLRVSPHARRVALADKLDNARAILADYRALGELLWSRFNAGRDDQFWYYEQLVQLFRGIGVTGRLIDEFETTVMLIVNDTRRIELYGR